MDAAYAYTLAAYETFDKTITKNDRLCCNMRELLQLAIDRRYSASRSEFTLADILDAACEAVDAMSYIRKTDGKFVHYQERSKPLMPKKKDFVKATTSTTVFKFDDSYLGFDRKSHSLEWNVDENNHAVSDAHAGWLWKSLSAALAKVEWTRNTGGVFTKNDEYNRDNDDVGGGANYISARFGPLGQDYGQKPRSKVRIR